MAKTTFFTSAVSTFSYDVEYSFQEFLLASSPAASQHTCHQFALLEFEKPVVCPPAAQVVGSRLDCDAYSNMCRIAFHGILAECITEKDYVTHVLPNLKIFKNKQREGIVDRVNTFIWYVFTCSHIPFICQVHDERTVIGKMLFKKETKIDLFTSMKVRLSTGNYRISDVAEVSVNRWSI